MVLGSIRQEIRHLLCAERIIGAPLDYRLRTQFFMSIF